MPGGSAVRNFVNVNPGTSHASGEQPEQPTAHEFVSRLVHSPEARAAFESDPRSTLGEAGFGDLSADDLQQVTSLVLDCAPVELVEEYGRTLHTSIEQFAAADHPVAVDQPHPEQEVTEDTMLHSTPETPDFTDNGDVDATMPEAEAPKAPQADVEDVNTDIDVSDNIVVDQQDSHNLIDVHDVNLLDGGILNGDILNGVLNGNDVANGAGNIVGNDLSDTVDVLDGPVNTVTDVEFDDVVNELPVDAL